MPGHDLIVIGASTGGLEALQTLVPGLEPNLPAAVLIVWHLAPTSIGMLPDILQPRSQLRVSNAEDHEPLERGRIYVAPPDHHLLVESGYVRLTRGPKENRFRPAVDPLFRSAAAAYGPRAIGVVLSGALDDGTAGLWAIKDRGGIAVVQEPSDAVEPSMPRSALTHVDVDHVTPVARLSDLLNTLAHLAVDQPLAQPADPALLIETQIAQENNPMHVGVLNLGPLSPFTCPECHGTLVELASGTLMRFRCHTGHAYTVGSLSEAIAETIEMSLWNSIRAMDEQQMLLQHLAQHFQGTDQAAGAERLRVQARAVEQQNQLMRLALLRGSATEPTVSAELR